MDFNHLKNIYFTEELFVDEIIDTLLQEIQLDSSYSRGTLVHVISGDASEEAKKKEQPKDGTPIHRLLNFWYNKEKKGQSFE